MPNPSLRDLNPLSEEIKKIAKLLGKERGIKGYESMSKYELLNVLISSKPVKKAKIKQK